MRHIKLVLVLLAAGLALSPCARAQIGYLDAPSAINYNANSLNPATFTVSPSANVLVVLIGDRNQGGTGSDPGAPTSVTWNGQTLTLAITANTGVSTYDDNSIYYLVESARRNRLGFRLVVHGERSPNLVDGLHPHECQHRGDT